MKIKVSDDNAAKIQAALDAVNGRASEHTYRTYGDIARLVTEAETRRADLRLSKREAKGIQVVSVSGDAVPTAYKWSRNATRVELTYCATGWCLTDLASTTIYADGGGSCTSLTPDLANLAVAKFQAAHYTVRAI
jgi:hypothetical protein